MSFVTGGYSAWIRPSAYSKITDEEDAKIFAALSAASVPEHGWVTKLLIGDTVWLVDLNKWATVVARWGSWDPAAVGDAMGRIQLAYDMTTYEWSVSADGRGMDGRIIMRKLTATSCVAEENPDLIGAICLSDVRNMVMVDVGKEWRDVVALLKDPMDVEGVGMGEAIWSAKGHSGDDDVGICLVSVTPSVSYVGKSGESIVVPAKIALNLTLSTAFKSTFTWDVSRFVLMDEPVQVFKAKDVMISICENPLLIEDTNVWGILTHPSR